MYVNSRIQLFPLLRIAIVIILGIITGNYFGSIISIYLCFLVLFLTFLFSIIVRKRVFLQTIFISMFFFFFGFFLILYQISIENVTWPSQPLEVEGVIVNTPILKERMVECDIRTVRFNCRDYENSNQLVKAFIVKDKCSDKLEIGDGIIFSSKVYRPYNRGRLKFNYAHYLVVHGFSGITYINDTYWQRRSVNISQISLIERTKLKFMRFRTVFLKRYKSLGFKDQTYAVIAALTLGDKSLLSKSTKDIYSHAGASHILALSGLHLGILYSIFIFLFRSRRFEFVLTALAVLSIWAFVFMVGMSPSVVRSAVMLSVYTFFSLLNRDKMSINTLSFAAIIMLVLNPQNLYDVGFELSFVAVLSILIFYRPLYELFNQEWLMHHRIIGYIVQVLSVSIAAQIGTFPLVIYYFGRFPIYFLLTNIVVVPCAQIIICLAMLIFSLWLLPSIQCILASILIFLVSLMNNLMDFINHLPASSIENLSPTIFQTILIYIVLFSVYSFLLRNTAMRLKLLLISIFVLLVSFLPISL
jgi:competence protein ComEC